jgi:hypothetical protein
MGEHSCLIGKSNSKSDIDKYGIGIALYFRFLKSLIKWFFFYSLLSIIPIYFNIKGYIIIIFLSNLINNYIYIKNKVFIQQ